MKIRLKQHVRVSLPTVKIGVSRQMVIPKKFYDTLGLVPGDYLEVDLYQGNRLLVTPKALVNRHPEIDHLLNEAENDIKTGRVSNSFATVTQLKRHLDAATR
ncbi:MAG: AbrB/MazE/SpoVT family DNA-binding domain-containing protein [bacterium]|nr:AbrB/MazE/SpoVT family DNA-binding domain-containing protein [bacterium]MDZ4300009.1 AbrB/MazE/SpoVT family DNA-binding domain-containing protein [Candidatus Sungbacteria bacterium]